jgi:hypothetical protein
MQQLSTIHMLDLWERAAQFPPVERAQAILAAATPERSAAELEALSVGECTDELLALQDVTFGRRLDGFAECPRCSQPLELALDISELRAAHRGASTRASQLLVERDYSVRFRFLGSADLTAASACGSVGAACALLLRRAVLSATRGGRRVSPGRLPTWLVERLALRLAEGDPLAELMLDLVCPECRHRWSVALDVGAFLWREIHGRVRSLLRDVHVLAVAYGWREADIVAMPARRRQAYLELAGA